MRLSEGTPLKTCANPQAPDQSINQTNVHENKLVWTFRDLSCSGASPLDIRVHRLFTNAKSDHLCKTCMLRQQRRHQQLQQVSESQSELRSYWRLL